MPPDSLKALLKHGFYGIPVSEYFTFCLATCIICFLVFFIDIAFCKLTNRTSLIGIQYNKGNALFLLSLWCLGGSFMGFVGLFGHLLQNNVQSIILIGIGWPLLFTNWVKKSEETSIPPDEDSQEEDA